MSEHIDSTDVDIWGFWKLDGGYTEKHCLKTAIGEVQYDSLPPTNRPKRKRFLTGKVADGPSAVSAGRSKRTCKPAGASTDIARQRDDDGSTAVDIRQRARSDCSITSADIACQNMTASQNTAGKRGTANDGVRDEDQDDEEEIIQEHKLEPAALTFVQDNQDDTQVRDAIHAAALDSFGSTPKPEDDQDGQVSMPAATDRADLRTQEEASDGSGRTLSPIENGHEEYHDRQASMPAATDHADLRSQEEASDEHARTLSPTQNGHEGFTQPEQPLRSSSTITPSQIQQAIKIESSESPTPPPAPMRFDIWFAFESSVGNARRAVIMDDAMSFEEAFAHIKNKLGRKLQGKNLIALYLRFDEETLFEVDESDTWTLVLETVRNTRRIALDGDVELE